MEELEARLAAAMGGPGGPLSEAEQAEREARFRALQAGHDGGRCGRCGRDLGPGEVVYRVGPPTCRGCLDAQRERLSPYPWALQRLDDDLLPPSPCAGCGRPVVGRRSGRPRARTVCSERCAWTVRNAPLKEVRLGARRGKTCPVCGEPFDGTRRDAVTCSPACRQKAYRRRAAEAR